MKSIIAVILGCLLLTTGITSAQGVEIECGDDLVIQDGIDVQFPTVSRDDIHYVTALGIGDYDPVLAVFNQQQFGSCNDDSVDAIDTDLEFPTTGYVPLSDFNAGMEFTGNTFMRAVMGDYDNLDGEAVLMVEGLTMDGQPDLVNVIVTERMIESQIPLTAYAIPATENLDLKMALVDDNGVPLFDDAGDTVECDDAGDNELCWGAHVSLLEAFTNVSETRITEGTAISPMLSIPLTPDDAGTIVPFQITQSPLDEDGITGEYVFILHYGMGDIGGVGEGLAQVEETPDGIQLSCDETLLLTDAIELTIPRLDSPATFGLFAQGIANPIFAEMISDTTGTCYITAGRTAEQSAELPQAGIFLPAASNTDTEIITESARLITGLSNDVIGSYLVVVEGLSIPPDGTPDVVSVTVTQSLVDSGLPVMAYMIATGTDLDPQLTLVSAEQEGLIDAGGALITCSHSTLPSQCYGEYEDMSNARVSFGVNNLVRGITSDVMLSIPLSGEMVGTSLNFMASGVDDTFGDYILMVYLSPGADSDDESESSENSESGD